MQTDTPRQEITLRMVNIPLLVDSFGKIKSATDTACKYGAFDLQSAYDIKMSLDNINKAIEVLSEYQKIIPSLAKKDDPTPI